MESIFHVVNLSLTMGVNLANKMRQKWHCASSKPSPRGLTCFHLPFGTSAITLRSHLGLYAGLRMRTRHTWNSDSESPKPRLEQRPHKSVSPPTNTWMNQSEIRWAQLSGSISQQTTDTWVTIMTLVLSHWVWHGLFHSNNMNKNYFLLLVITKTLKRHWLEINVYSFNYSVQWICFPVNLWHLHMIIWKVFIILSNHCTSELLIHDAK